MVTSIYYSNATDSVRELLGIEFPSLKVMDVDKLVNIFHKLANYEEEGLKVRPNIILTSNISAVIKAIPDTTRIAFYHENDSTNFNQRIKSLMCFCSKDWMLYIEYGDNYVEYGIVKVLNSIKDKNLDSLIFTSPNKENLQQKVSLVHINVISAGLIVIGGIKGNQTSICFNLNNNLKFNWEEEITQFVNESLTKLKTTKKKLEAVKNLYQNIFNRVFKKLHGTICLIVDKEYRDTKGFLADGTWLPEPIDLGKAFLKVNSFSESKLRGFADILETMLNYDGITVIDNAGKIRAYNVFVENDPKVTKNIIGGARTRAAYTLLNTNNRKIIGVYFQSQEGDTFYKSKKEAKHDVKVAEIEATKKYTQIEINITDQKDTK